MTAPLRIGIVGAGYIAGVIARAIDATPAATLTAIASRTRAKAQHLVDAHPGARVADDWRDLVASADVDAVYVATPTSVREDISIGVARAGRHLLAEKPFANVESVRAITAACRGACVAFLDATHFTHHPRTRRIRIEIATRLGAIRAMHSCFFFPNDDRANIRYDPAKEPTGAIGDMAWYSARAVAEFASPSATLVSASGVATRDAVTGAIVRGAGVLHLSDGCTTTWDAGYDTGVFVQDLTLMGERGLIALDDFVLDWSDGFAVPSPGHVASFTVRTGLAIPAAFERVETPADRRQAVAMIEAFVGLARDPRSDAAAASIAITERTQALVDAMVRGLAFAGGC